MNLLKAVIPAWAVVAAYAIFSLWARTQLPDAPIGVPEVVEDQLHADSGTGDYRLATEDVRVTDDAGFVSHVDSFGSVNRSRTISASRRPLVDAAAAASSASDTASRMTA